MARTVQVQEPLLVPGLLQQNKLEPLVVSLAGNLGPLILQVTGTQRRQWRKPLTRHQGMQPQGRAPPMRGGG